MKERGEKGAYEVIEILLVTTRSKLEIEIWKSNGKGFLLSAHFLFESWFFVHNVIWLLIPCFQPSFKLHHHHRINWTGLEIVVLSSRFPRDFVPRKLNWRYAWKSVWSRREKARVAVGFCFTPTMDPPPPLCPRNSSIKFGRWTCYDERYFVSSFSSSLFFHFIFLRSLLKEK